MINRQLNTPGDLLAYDPSTDGDITLMDVVAAIVAHWGLIAVVSLLGLAAAGIWTLVNQPAYVYRSSIEIGTTVDQNPNQAPRLIDSPRTVLAKLQENYIPLARTQYARAHPDVTGIPRIEARLPESTELIVLESLGPRGRDEEQLQQDLHATVVDRLAADHRRTTEVARNILEARKADAERQLHELLAQPAMLATQAKRLEAVRQALQKQVAELRDSVAASSRARRDAGATVKDEARVLSLLVVDQEMQAARSRLSEMEERLNVTLPAEMDDLQKAIADSQRGEVVQRRLIEQSKAELANLHETRALSPAFRSPSPRGRGRTTILALGGGFGLVLGCLIAVVRELTVRSTDHRRAPTRA